MGFLPTLDNVLVEVENNRQIDVVVVVNQFTNLKAKQ